MTEKWDGCERKRRLSRQEKQNQRGQRRRKMRKVFMLGVCLLLFIIAVKAGKSIWSIIEVSILGDSQVAVGNQTIFSINNSKSHRNKKPNWLTDDYPDSLKELYENNEETEDFVKDYFQEKDKKHEINLSDEVEYGKIPLFLQWDKRWGYENYGSDIMAVTGCGPTCLSMVLCGLRGDTKWDPLSVAKVAEENGYYVEGAGSSWSLMSEGAQLFGLTSLEVSFDEDSIRGELQEGHPIICVMGPGTFTTTGHFIVLSGMDENGQILVRDPNSRKRSKVAWDLQTLMGQMQNLWSYR